MHYSMALLCRRVESFGSSEWSQTWKKLSFFKFRVKHCLSGKSVPESKIKVLDNMRAMYIKAEKIMKITISSNSVLFLQQIVCKNKTNIYKNMRVHMVRFEIDCWVPAEKNRQAFLKATTVYPGGIRSHDPQLRKPRRYHYLDNAGKALACFVSKNTTL
jgi:hypothetical protein